MPKRKPLAVKTKHTQTAIAEKTGISQPAISNYLALKHKPSKLHRLALQDNFPELLQKIDNAWLTK